MRICEDELPGYVRTSRLLLARRTLGGVDTFVNSWGALLLAGQSKLIQIPLPIGSQAFWRDAAGSGGCLFGGKEMVTAALSSAALSSFPVGPASQRGRAPGPACARNKRSARGRPGALTHSYAGCCSSWIKPRRMAYLTAPAVSWMSNFSINLARCDAAVLLLIPS